MEKEFSPQLRDQGHEVLLRNLFFDFLRLFSALMMSITGVRPEAMMKYQFYPDGGMMPAWL